VTVTDSPNTLPGSHYDCGYPLPFWIGESEGPFEQMKMIGGEVWQSEQKRRKKEERKLKQEKERKKWKL
jgi:hypothetical protein